MKLRHLSLRRRGLTVLAAVAATGFLGGCIHHVARSPSLTQQPERVTAPRPESALGKAADTTWNVVSAPVRWVIPGKKKPAATQPRYEPGELIIMGPNGGTWQPNAAAENATEPTTQSK